MGPNLGYEGSQPSGGISPGGNRHTQIPAARQSLDPSADSQGVGFWTGKYSPKGKPSKDSEADFSRLTSFQEHGASNEVVRYFEGVPKDDEETIKSLSSKRLFAMAKIAFRKGDIPLFAMTKAELERRRMDKAMGYHAKVDHGAGRSAAAGRGNESMQANRDKRVFEAVHGVPANDEASTDDSTPTEERTPTEDTHPVGAGADSGDSPVGKSLAGEKADLNKNFLDQLRAQLKVATKPKVEKPTSSVTLVAPSQSRSHAGYMRTDPRTGKLQNIKQRGTPKPKEPAAPEAVARQGMPTKDDSKEAKWETLVNHGVVLPPPYKPRGLKVAGVKNDKAEEMFYRLAPQLMVEDADKLPDDLFCKNFTDDLQKYAGLKVEPTLSALRKAGALVIKARRDESEARKDASRAKSEAKRKMRPEELRKLKMTESPHLLAVRDGEMEDLTGFAGTLLESGVFIGARTHGKWQAPERGRFIPQPTYADITLNGSSFPKDAAKYGKTTNDPKVEWTAKIKYADGCGREEQVTRVAVRGKIAAKWESVRKYGQHYKGIKDGIARDLSATNPAMRKLATALSIMDALHIRNGGGEGEGIGACDLTTEHIWLKGNDLLFDFEAKAGEHETHKTMGVRKLTDQTVKNLRELGVGDKPAPEKAAKPVFDNLRLRVGSELHAGPAAINAWLKVETQEPKLTAHKVRHHHAGLYFAEKWSEVKKRGKPKTKKDAQRMLNECTHHASKRLGHAVKADPTTGGPTARGAYIDPQLVQAAMVWMGYDLSTKKEQKEERFKFKKELSR